ncbi:MAG: hypothetical protein EU541_00805 [Promethearchaeota archaeon]|nr:MAG: hypothetical protein EU541_00805 [Candidatus Lokiarchaeota archaeon]
MSEINMEYSQKQGNVARAFYLVLVGGWLVTITGVIWTFIDFFNPFENLTAYFEANPGYLFVAIFAIFLFLFFLMIFFVGFYRKGRKSLLKILYTKKELEEKYKDSLGIKITAGGVIASIMGLLISILIVFILEALPGTESTLLIMILSLMLTSTGTLILSIGLLIFLIVGIILLCVYSIRNGFYLIAKAIYKLSA